MMVVSQNLRRIAASGLVALAALLPVQTAGAQQQSAALPAIGMKKADPNAQMLLNADQLVYDYDGGSVSAVGNVQIYYDGYTLEADRVVYNQRTGRVQAEGNVRMTEPSGNVVRSNALDITDDFGDGIVDSLRVETPDRTRFAAGSAERVSKDVTILRNGVYTACEACKKDPTKPPLWQVKAARVVYDQKERMIYYKDAQLEFFGYPVAYMPYFSHPDPTAGRKSGFLQPGASYSEELGVGISTPYYFNLAPNYDLTVTPTAYTNQGLLAAGDFRHRLLNGSYSIRGAGILQGNPEVFGWLDEPVREVPSPGNREARGYLRATGDFQINDWWSAGFDAWALSDRTFIRNYSLVSPGTTEVVSNVYLTGLSDRSYFDARALKFQTLSASESQDYMPAVHPVVDYNKVFDDPVWGGQLSLDLNFVSLSRDDPSFAFSRLGQPDQRAFIKGLPGTSNRTSVKAEWERQLVDEAGQVYTPFAYVRGDAFGYDIARDSVIDQLNLDPNAIGFEDEFAFRGIPAIGVEYQYPFMSAHSWGTQVVGPIGQLVARTDEQRIGELPNEDSQSLVFDDTTLFERDKFSGFDRAEGGVRANVGASYTVAADSGANANILFGQSFHLAGQNSFEGEEDEQLGVGLDSGLEDDVSDYVGRLLFEPVPNIALVTRFRLDKSNFDTERVETGVQFTRGPIAASLIYADLDPQPNLGADEPRQEVVGNGTYKLNPFWRLTGGGRYDLEREQARSASVGLIYEDECFSFGLTYVGQYYKDEDAEPDNRIMVQFNLRTLGGGTFSQSLSPKTE